MPLSGPRLKTAFKDAIRTAIEEQIKPTLPWSDLSNEDKSKIQQGWDKLAEAISSAGPEAVNEIVTNAQVNTTVALGIPTTCAAGPGSTTSTGTGSGGVS
jgi:hypothetical protein